MCMSCKGSKAKMVSSNRTTTQARSTVRRVVSSSKYGSPKVRMSFGSHKK